MEEDTSGVSQAFSFPNGGGSERNGEGFGSQDVEEVKSCGGSLGSRGLMSRSVRKAAEKVESISAGRRAIVKLVNDFPRFFTSYYTLSNTVKAIGIGFFNRWLHRISRILASPWLRGNQKSNTSGTTSQRKVKCPFTMT